MTWLYGPLQVQSALASARISSSLIFSPTALLNKPILKKKGLSEIKIMVQRSLSLSLVKHADVDAQTERSHMFRCRRLRPPISSHGVQSLCPKKTCIRFKDRVEQFIVASCSSSVGYASYSGWTTCCVTAHNA
jgi:hypothetical protein